MRLHKGPQNPTKLSTLGGGHLPGTIWYLVIDIHWLLDYWAYSMIFITVCTSLICVAMWTLFRVMNLHVLRCQETVFVLSLASSSLYCWSASRMIAGRSEMVREPHVAFHKFCPLIVLKRYSTLIADISI